MPKAMRWRFTAWEGRDLWRSLFSQKRQASWLAQKLTRVGGPFADWNFAGEAMLIVENHGGRWRVLDGHGHVEAYTGDLRSSGL